MSREEKISKEWKCESKRGREREGLDSLALGLLANSVLTLGWPEQNRVFANADISFTIFTRSHMLLLLQGLHVIFSQVGCQ